MISGDLSQLQIADPDVTTRRLLRRHRLSTAREPFILPVDHHDFLALEACWAWSASNCGGQR